MTMRGSGDEKGVRFVAKESDKDKGVGVAAMVRGAWEWWRKE